MNPAARSANDELVNLALIGLVAAFALALVLRAAGNGRPRSRPVRPRPTGGIASGLRVLTDPGRPGASVRRPRAVRARLLERRRRCSSASSRHSPGACGDWSPGSGTGLLDDPHRIQGIATARDIDADGVEEGPRTTRRDPPSLDPAPEGERRRLPARTQLWPRDLGIGRGLDPRHRSAALRQGTAPRHQRDPRRARRRRHHLHPARQHRRHHRRPRRTRAGRRLRPAAPHRGTARGQRQRRPLVTDPRLRAPADRDDPRLRPRVVDRTLLRRRGVRRLLGRQDPLRAPGPAPRRRTRAPPDPSPLRVVAVRLRRNRRRRHPRQPPRRRRRLVRLARRHDQLRPAHPRLHLDGRLPSPRLPRRPRRARRRQPRARRGVRPARLPHPERHALPARHRRRRRRLVAARRRVHRRPHRDRPPPRRRVARRPPRPARCCWRSTRSATSPRSPRCPS